MFNNLSTFLPSKPYHKQVYVDNNNTKWVYNAIEQSWEQSGPTAVSPLVSDKIAGLISSDDKTFIDSIPQKPGGFGIIVQPQAVLVSPQNPDGTINGKIKIVSDSLEISCNVGSKPQQECKTGQIQLLQCENVKSFQMLSFKIREEFLKTLIIKPAIGTGPKGPVGDQGPEGAPGFGDGPPGITGANGQSTDVKCKLSEITFNDVDEVTKTAAVDITVSDTGGNGCQMVMTHAPISEQSVIVDKLSLPSIGRSVVYNESNADLCSVSRLNDYRISAPLGDTTGELYVVRLPSSDISSNDVQLNNTMSFTTFIQSVVDLYVDQLKKVDMEYGKAVKEHVSAIDSRARSNLASIAGQLTQCQFQLPSIEYGISFVSCGTPVTSNPVPTTTSPPNGIGRGPGPSPVGPGLPVGPTTTSSPVRLGSLGSSSPPLDVTKTTTTTTSIGQIFSSGGQNWNIRY